jgi:hypothetical protein
MAAGIIIGGVVVGAAGIAAEGLADMAPGAGLFGSVLDSLLEDSSLAASSSPQPRPANTPHRIHVLDHFMSRPSFD